MFLFRSEILLIEWVDHDSEQSLVTTPRGFYPITSFARHFQRNYNVKAGMLLKVFHPLKSKHTDFDIKSVFNKKSNFVVTFLKNKQIIIDKFKILSLMLVLHSGGRSTLKNTP